MEYLGEIIALGIDTVVFAICLKQYIYYKNSIEAVKVDKIIQFKILEIHYNLKRNMLKNIYTFKTVWMVENVYVYFAEYRTV